MLNQYFRCTFEMARVLLSLSLSISLFVFLFWNSVGAFMVFRACDRNCFAPQRRATGRAAELGVSTRAATSGASRALWHKSDGGPSLEVFSLCASFLTAFEFR